MNVAIFNTQCKMDVRVIQKYSSLSITCCVSLTWKEMDAGLLQSKMHGSLLQSKMDVGLHTWLERDFFVPTCI
jgi:hypothetical protein